MLEDLSYGSNIGNLRTIGASRVWWSLKILFGFIFVSLRAFLSKFVVSIPTIHLSNKNIRNRLSSPDGRTDRRFTKKFSFFFLINNIQVYTYLDYFSNFTPLWPNLVYLFFHIGNRYKNIKTGLSFGSNFGSLHAILSNRVWRFSLVHTFKIIKPKLILSNGSWDIENSLKISFGFYFVNLRAMGSNFWLCRFHVYIFQTKNPNWIIFIRSSVLM